MVFFNVKFDPAISRAHGISGHVEDDACCDYGVSPRCK